MPIKPIPPRQGFSPYWYGRGTHLGVFVDRSTKARTERLARKVIVKWERDIESGVFAKPKEATFASAAVSYIQAGGERTFLVRVIEHFKDMPLRLIDQAAVDGCAVALYPDASAATRNRQVYTPVSAVCTHAGKPLNLKRPKGAGGEKVMAWLTPEQAFPLIEEAYKQSAEFGILCTVLLYTGLRLSEPLSLTCDDVNLQGAELICGRTKNGNPRRVFLPPTAVSALANHPAGLNRPGQRLFRYHKAGRLYELLRKAAAKAGVTLPRRAAFHIFRHTWATWMRRYAGADIDTLLGTGAWDSRQSAGRYMHMVVSEESKRALLLPAPKKVSGAD